VTTAEEKVLFPGIHPGRCPYRPNIRSKRGFHCWHDRNLQATYGPAVTCEVYWTKLVAINDGRCQLCGLTPWPKVPTTSRPAVFEHLAVDHCHRTGLVRGAAHASCQGVITEGWAMRIEGWDPAHPGPIPLSGGEEITVEVVVYIRNPPAAGLGLFVPPELQRLFEDRRAAWEERERRYASGEQRRPTRGRKARRGPRTSEPEPPTGERRDWLHRPPTREDPIRAWWHRYRRNLGRTAGEGAGLARRILEASWDRRHAPRLWVQFGDRWPSDPRWTEKWARRGRREEWVWERLAPLVEVARAAQVGNLPSGMVLMPHYPDPADHPRN
jgi:Recombination endonuclease VII